MDTLVLPIPTLQRLLSLVVAQGLRQCFLAVGVRRMPDGRDWLGRGVSVRPPPQTVLAFEVRLSDQLEDGRLWSLADRGPSLSGVLWLGTAQRRGQVSGIAVEGRHVVPIERLLLPGPGMQALDLTPRPGPLRRQIAADDDMRARERWSRSIAALGNAETWERLVGLKVAVIGAGRSGTLAARTLTAMGVRHVTLIDPDVVERHNLGESDGMDESDIGRHKALAVAQHLRAARPDDRRTVAGIAASIWDPHSVEVAKRSDVIFSCVDRDAPRLAATIIATAHHRVLIDVGTGVLFGDDPDTTTPQRRMGADVRVILPGEGCLLCRGGLTDYDGALLALTNPQSPPPTATNAVRGFSGRAGSLRSLNLVAVGAAVRLLEGVVASQAHGGWLRLEDPGTGRLQFTDPEAAMPERGEDCALCLRAGMGDTVI